MDQLVPNDGPLVFGLDETLERRWGRKINARGIYRDAVAGARFVPAIVILLSVADCVGCA